MKRKEMREIEFECCNLCGRDVTRISHFTFEHMERWVVEAHGRESEYEKQHIVVSCYACMDEFSKAAIKDGSKLLETLKALGADCG